MKKVVVAFLIFSWSPIYAADTDQSDVSSLFNVLPEAPEGLWERIRDFKEHERAGIREGVNSNRFQSPRNKCSIKKTNSRSEWYYRVYYSEEDFRVKNAQSAKNTLGLTYLTASMAMNYLDICTTIKEQGLSVRAEETYLLHLDKAISSYDDTNSVIMQEISPSIKISTRNSLNLSEDTIKQMLALIHYACIWCPEKAFKVMQKDGELQLVVSACMLPASCGNFWDLSREDQNYLRRTGYTNLRNYFDQRQDPKLANYVYQYAQEHDTLAAKKMLK